MAWLKIIGRVIAESETQGLIAFRVPVNELK